MVFYRKYRPQKIEELDNKDLREVFYSFLSQKEISQAFLFTGPKGLGKTSTARIIAKAINCEGKSKIKNQKSKIQIKTQNFEDVDPCGECEQCISITKGSNLDVLEIDGASNRGIDEIRDLREKVRLSQISARKKVYIIDEVHMLTIEAFNALLKTLEEPPNHVVFILCTTEPQKVPATIISRCVHVSFPLAKTEDLVNSLKRIVKGEKLDVEEEALSFIASFSEGSFRDGAKIMEELVAMSGGKKITKELVEKRYKVSSIKYQVLEMLNHLSAKNTKEGLNLVKSLVEQGVDMKYFVEQLINELHRLLLVEMGIEKEFRILASRRSGQNLEFRIEEIKELVKLLAKAHGEIKQAVLPQLPLELVIIEFSMIGDVVSSITVEETQAQNQAEQHTEQRRIQRESAFRSASINDKKEQAKKDDDITSVWQELIDKVKQHNHSIAGVLRGCSLKSYDNNVIVIEAKYKFHKDRLNDKEILEILEKAGEEITGNKVKVGVVLKGGDKE